MAEVIETERIAEPALAGSADVIVEGAGLRWGAVLGGAVSALGLWILLYVFGLAIGLSSIDPSDPRSMRPSGMFAGIWALIAPIAALFVGGWVAGRGAGIVGRGGGVVHGLVAWSVTTLVGGAFLMFALSAVVGGIASIGKEVARAGGEAAAAAVGAQSGGTLVGIDTSDALQPVNARRQAAGEPPVPPAALEDAARAASSSALAQGRFDKVALVQAIIADTGLPQADAAEIADRMEAQYQQRTAQLHSKAQAAAQSAKTGALKVAEQSGKAFWGVFGALLLGLAAALLGGAAGASAIPRRLKRELVTPRVPAAPPREVYP